MIPQTNFVYIFLLSRLFQHQEQIHHKRTIIRPHMHHEFQQWYEGQVNETLVGTWRKSQPQGQSMYLQGEVRVLVDDVFYKEDALLYWKFTNILEWCRLKSNIL